MTDYEDLQTKTEALHKANQKLWLAYNEEETARATYKEAESVFIKENFISLQSRELTGKAYEEKKKMELFQTETDYKAAKTSRQLAAIESETCRENLNTLKKLISIQ